ncbi:sulfurtransferase complex subunit TusC [Candidatus Vesicomyidisocius calyptogenae]|uniref:Intracellular sulfur oxidation protein DsrF n=1 Tax=Vesicomyosocius okutanii subsp. Calyptogena okutanii (strain HA) TaxID=412965 RepID=A5CVW3_VESOH|nr:sulfurtransferase complex subunit TusC [Candidatus Vesicomyosocius okutanii]BAF61898.1 intracellular sulfur oxidation protein DsrF [Candidatus Vesicomyosocius okutanii]
MSIKKFMYLNRRSSFGTVYAIESLEVVLVAAAFDQDVSLAFIDDGVYQIIKGQNTNGIGMKNFSKTFHALGDYEINKLYVSAESLEERGLSADDLMPLVYEDEDDNWEEKSSVKVVSNLEISKIMSKQDVCFSF